MWAPKVEVSTTLTYCQEPFIDTEKGGSDRSQNRPCLVNPLTNDRELDLCIRIIRFTGRTSLGEGENHVVNPCGKTLVESPRERLGQEFSERIFRDRIRFTACGASEEEPVRRRNGCVNHAALLTSRERSSRATRPASVGTSATSSASTSKSALHTSLLGSMVRSIVTTMP